MKSTPSRGPRGAAVGWSVLLASAGGCQRETATKSPENAERTALIAQRCPELELGSEPIDAKNARVFVEVVELSGGEPPNPIGQYLDEHTVTVRSSSNLIAFPNVPTSMPWGQCVDAVCSGTQRTLTLTAQLPERGSDPIELALRIDAPTPEGGPAAAPALLDTTLRAASQQPVLLPVSAALRSGPVVVTPYLVRQLEDLHRVLECQARQAEKRKPLH